MRRDVCQRRPGRRRRAARTTLAHLLNYSLITLAGATLLAAVAGWIVAGRILRPVHRITAAARAACEQNLSQRIALRGPRDELRELADTFDAMLDRLDRAFTGQRQFIANASHELRTPLTVMRTTIDVVLAKPDPTPRRADVDGRRHPPRRRSRRAAHRGAAGPRAQRTARLTEPPTWPRSPKTPSTGEPPPASR